MRLPIIYSILFFLFTCFYLKGVAHEAYQNSINFKRNVGQITDQFNNTRKDILYILTTNELNVFFSKNAIHYQWYHQYRNDSNTISTYRMDVKLIGADSNSDIKEEYPTNDYEVYYTNGLKGKVANSFKKITYKNIYPHIDWVLYIKGNDLKYDFIIHKGGNVANIKLGFYGANKLYLKNERLIAETPFGSIEENPPYGYEEATGNTIASSFSLSDNILSYSTNKKDNIIIDPLLDWATYYGGLVNDGINAITYDSLGKIYLTGNSASATNIATVGAYQTTLQGIYDLILIKFSAYDHREWATYFGGPDIENGKAITCKGDKVYIAGYTKSNIGISTIGSWQSSFGGGTGNDGLLAQFDTSGFLIWATYYGGNDEDNFQGITTDSTGNIYVTGSTKSFQNIASINSYQASNSGQMDGMLVKFNSLGQRLWGTYIGGLSNDQMTSVTTGKNGNIYVAGFTNSMNNISTTGGYQPTYSDSTDGFFMCFNQSGSKLWGTYYGGSGYDNINAICTDVSDNVYICGSTKSQNNIATAGVYQTNINSATDSYIAKFNNSGLLQWGTYYGGNANDNITCIKYKPSTNKILITGSTYSTNNITTSNALQTSYSGLNNYTMFYSEFDTLGALYYGTYYGPGYSTGANTLIVDTIHNRTYIAGITASSTGIATMGAYDTTFQGQGSDALIMCLIDNTGVFEPPSSDSIACQGQIFMVYNNIQLAPFFSNNVYKVQLSDANGSFSNPIVIGSDTTPIGGYITCIIPNNTPPGSGYRIRIVSSNPYLTSLYNGYNIQIFPITIGITDSITVTPSNNIPAGTTVNFIATITNGGSNPHFQWRKNGINILGATSNTYTTNNLTNNDTVNCIVISSLPCIIPTADTSNNIIMHVTSDITDIKNTPLANIYPNPFSKYFTISTNTAGTIIISSMDGREVNRQYLSKGNYYLQFPQKCQAGLYLVNFISSIDGSSTKLKLIYKP